MVFRLVEEFKEFAVKGNMVDIAVGVIIGSAFNKVVDALVKELFLPPLSLMTDGIRWEDKKLILREAIKEGDQIKYAEIAMGYGKIVENFIDFLVIGFTIFLVVKLMNSLKRKAQDPVDKKVATPKDIELLHHIATLLEQQNEHLKKTKNSSPG